MNTSLSLFVLLALFALSAFSDDYFLQFSHQAPQAAISVDLFVNDHILFRDVPYGEVRGVANITALAVDDSNIFLLTVAASTTGTVINSANYTFVEDTYSYFVVNTVSGGLDYLFVDDDYSAPQQLHGLWRVTNFAPVNQTFVLYINGAKQTGFEYGSITDYASVSDGIYEFVVKSTTGTWITGLNATVTSGAVVTIFFNGLGTVATPYAFSANLDQDYAETYTSCFVRVVNSVANANYNALTPVFIPGEDRPFENVTYNSPTDYAELEAGVYKVYFAQDDAVDYTTAPSVTFTCEASQSFTLTYQGTPGSITTPLTALSSIDDAAAPYYLEAKLRLDLLSTSYDQLIVFVDSVQVTTISYSTASTYISVTEQNANLTLVGSNGIVLTETLDLSMGQTFSYFVLGVSGSTSYPVTGTLTDDSGGDQPSTTTSTSTGSTSTTGSTTGGHHDDDDDDDDLSGGEIAGIVIGVIAGVVILGGLGFWVVRRQRRSQFSTIG